MINAGVEEKKAAEQLADEMKALRDANLKLQGRHDGTQACSGAMLQRHASADLTCRGAQQLCLSRASTRDDPTACPASSTLPLPVVSGSKARAPAGS